jgi:hypothetical protein
MYSQLLAKHDEPFRSIAKSTMDVSLVMIAATIDNFKDIIKALPQTTVITTPGRPKHFITIGLSIIAMAMSSFNAYRIMQLDSEITALKSKTDLLVDVSRLNKAHLNHLEEKTDATNKVLGNALEANIWFSSKIMNAIEKKFLSVVHHHENAAKLAQHHRLPPEHCPMMSLTKS